MNPQPPVSFVQVLRDSGPGPVLVPPNGFTDHPCSGVFRFVGTLVSSACVSLPARAK